MPQTRRSFLTGAATTAGLFLAAPGRASTLQTIGGRAFGSYWRLVTGDRPAPVEARGWVAQIVEDVDAALSPYRPASEICRLNRHDSGDWIALSAGMTTVLGAALTTAQFSGGAFDPTVGPVVGQFGFGPIRGHRTGDVGDLSLSDGRIRKANPGLTIDLCGIGKGWALDRMAARLDQAGITSYVLELGGEVLARGHHPEGRPWRIAIDGTDRALAPVNLAVATSGQMAQSYRLEDRQYGHIIDPFRNTPATGDLISVTVLSDAAMQADAWATALFSCGGSKALDLAETRGIDAVFVLSDGAGQKLLTTGARARALMI